MYLIRESNISIVGPRSPPRKCNSSKITSDTAWTAFLCFHLLVSISHTLIVQRIILLELKTLRSGMISPLSFEISEAPLVVDGVYDFVCRGDVDALSFRSVRKHAKNGKFPTGSLSRTRGCAYKTISITFEKLVECLGLNWVKLFVLEQFCQSWLANRTW
jgi:hypothetical protein